MRKLLLIRHAKSSWKDSSLDDHDRPLNKRGQRDRLSMAQFLADKSESLDAVVSSSAVRALSFARAISDATGVSLFESQALYTFSDDQLLRCIQQLDDSQNAVALVGHNPAITNLANRLTGADIANVPTAGIVAMQCADPDWYEVTDGCATLLYFTAPKLLL